MESGPFLAWAVGVLVIGMVGVLDYVTGPYISFSIFYFLPVGLMAWLVAVWRARSVPCSRR